MKLSFKKRIATYNLLAIAALLALAFTAIFSVVYYTSYEHLDDDIRTEKAEVFSNLDWNENTLIINRMPEWEEAEHNQVEVNPTFIQIVDLQGETIFKSANLQGNHFLFNPNNKTTVFYNATINQQKIRQGQFPVFNDNGKIIAQLTIGISQQESYNVLHNLLIVLLSIYVCIIFMLYFIMSFVASKAIAPVNQLIQSAAQINYANINSRLPLPENKDEIHQLAQTINDLLSRLENSFYQQKQFTSDASHEMQTPVAGIKGIIEVLLRKPRTQERYEEKMREVLVQTNRLSQLHDQLLQLARLESTVFVANKEKVTIAEIIKKCLSAHEMLIVKYAILVQNNVPLETVVCADSIQLEMIVDNLISNAIKYNKSGGRIGIYWDATTRTLSIEDEGIGIDTDQVPFLFNRFFRADDSRSSQIPGNGLGLSIVQRLCELQNIKLSVSSTISKGSTFSLHFPS